MNQKKLNITLVILIISLFLNLLLVGYLVVNKKQEKLQIQKLQVQDLDLKKIPLSQKKDRQIIVTQPKIKENDVSQEIIEEWKNILKNKSDNKISF